MANTQHSTLTDPELHEPKGVAAASANEVYVANGSASGSWAPLELSFNIVIADISTAETVYIPIPYAGTITKVVSVLEGAIATADATITPKDASGSSMGTLTVAFSGSAAGDVDTLTPASNNTVTADSFITVETDGASTNTVRLFVTVILQRS